MSWQIRQAVLSDIEWLRRVDPVAAKDHGRRAQIERVVGAGECWVACETSDPSVPIGYGCLDKSFFGEWFIPLVVVSNAHRRSGVGRQIVAHLEHCSSARKIFTSTNTSNAPMRQGFSCPRWFSPWTQGPGLSISDTDMAQSGY